MEGRSSIVQALALGLFALVTLTTLPARAQEPSAGDGAVDGAVAPVAEAQTQPAEAGAHSEPAEAAPSPAVEAPAVQVIVPQSPAVPATPAIPAAPAPAAPAVQPPAPQPTAALEEQLRQRVAAIDPSDTAALLDAAMWASRVGLDRQAAELLARVIGLDSDNTKARQALRQVRIGAQWYSLVQAAQVLSADATAAGYEPAVAATIQQMRVLASKGEEKAAVEALAVHVKLCQGAIDEAAAGFARLASLAPAGSPTRTRMTTLADILTKNADGLYVLTEPYPSEALLLDKPGQIVPAGPASLADRRVLTAALRDRARGFVAEGVKQAEQARLLSVSDPSAVEQACQRALAQFDLADALVAEISQSYRVDVARCQIDALRLRTESAAAGFDAELADLGRQELALEAYKTKLTNMLDSARQIRQDLETILRIAQPYPRDLVMEIRWAQQDRARMQSIQDTLRQELHDAQ